MNQFFLDEQSGKNTHMTHIEDAIFFQGVEGARQAIQFLRTLRDTLQGHTKNPMSVSVKWDGAPAVFAGTDPTDGKFFVAKKGIFNKNPVVYKTPAEIDADVSGDLGEKLKLALKYMSGLNIKGVIQGDFLFGPGDLSSETIMGEKYITFHPNTIVYAVPVDSGFAREIKRAKIGIAWHTSYTGDSFESMKAHYGVNVDALGHTPAVFQIDAMYRDVSGSATLTAQESQQLSKLLQDAGRNFTRVKGQTFNTIAGDPEVHMRFSAFANQFIRQGRNLNPAKAAQDMINYLNDQVKKAQAKVKTDAAKKRAMERFKPLIRFVANTPKQEMLALFSLYRNIQDAKSILINKVTSRQFASTFLKTRSGFHVTDHEGVVAIDHLGQNAVKLVDRLQFSMANFDPRFVKGWDNGMR